MKYRILCIPMIAIIGVMTYLAFFYSPVYRKIDIELGDQLTTTQFLKIKNKAISYKEAPDEKMLHTIGTYDLILIVNGKEYSSCVNIQDTTAPEAKAQPVSVFINHPVTPDDFISNIKDESAVTSSFQEEPDIKKAGDQEVAIILTDEGANTTTLNATLTITPDDEAPVIKGVKDLTVPMGFTVVYKKGVTVSDNSDDDIKLQVNADQVNLKKIGTYPVIYTASDIAGNTTTKEAKVKVVRPSSVKVTDELLQQKADQVLAEILTDNMSKRQKCKAIYRWVHNHIRWVGTSNKSSWKRGAWHGFTVRSGDCFTYFCVSKVLLTRAGIQNIDLSASTNAHHYWNFVKVEGGWYHLDAAPRADKAYLCLRTDAWISKYSLKHRLGYKWDQKNKPRSARK